MNGTIAFLIVLLAFWSYFGLMNNKQKDSYTWQSSSQQSIIEVYKESMEHP